MTTTRRSRPLYRDPDDKMIGGVCSGLGHYFDVDTLLVRVGFVVITLLGGGGVLAYLILWAIVDPAPPGALEPPTETEPPAIEVDTIVSQASLGDGDVDEGEGEDTLETPALEAPAHEELRIDEP